MQADGVDDDDLYSMKKKYARQSAIHKLVCAYK